MLEEIREGIANLTDVTNRHLVKLIEITEAAAEEAKRSSTEHVPMAGRDLEHFEQLRVARKG
jgi:hypothetical protein